VTGPTPTFSAASAFSASDYDVFRYTAVDFDESTGEAVFGFQLTGAKTVDFAERVTFTMPADAASADLSRARAVLVLLGAVLGLSYYKAAAPGRYEVEPAGLTAQARDYLRETLHNGLAEFAYRNDLPALLDPEIVLVAGVADRAPAADFAAWRLDSPVVPIGGGKDSVVSVESLADAGLSVTQFAVNPNSIIRQVAATSGKPFVAATRRIDPLLLALNGSGALNGHVPVTAMNSLIAVTQSLLLGLGPVVMSNESSASDPNLTWNGQEVNHQWSKGLAAELLLADTLEAQTGLAGLYFSLLRPFSELRIARKFAAIDGYDHAIVSCNRAYRIGAPEPGWCGECPKCEFVFLAFAPFMSRERLVGIVGKNLFDDPDLLQGYRALLGLDSHKPFECVGEEAESSVAMSWAARSPEWADTAIVRALLAEVPTLADGAPALEAQVFADNPAPALPSEAYEVARRARD
jgi:hypothetical protein